MSSTKESTSAYLTSDNTARTSDESFSLRSLFPPVFWSNSGISQTDNDYLNKSTSVTETEDDYPQERIITHQDEKTDLNVFPSLVSAITESTGSKCSQNLKKSANSTHPLSSIRTQIDLPIDFNILRKICFDECLLISCETKARFEGKQHLGTKIYPNLLGAGESCQVGGMRLCVQQSGENIIVDSVSQFSYEGNEANNIIVSLIDKHFASIEEKKTEALHTANGKEEKILHVFRDRGQYVSYFTWINQGHTKRRCGRFNFPRPGDLILDGAGLALMRYLVLNKFEGDLEAFSLNINGQICHVVYKVGKQKKITFEGRPYSAICITKLLFAVNRKTEISKTYYLPTGHLVHHCWANCPYFIHINPTMARILRRNCLSTSLEITSENYVQLLLKYLNFQQAIKFRTR